MEIQFVEATTENQFNDAKALFIEYGESLGFSLCFQGFQEELDTIQQHYNSSLGGIWLAYSEVKAVGVVALRKFGDNTGEVKRMYVQPNYHGNGIGKKLMQLLIDKANAVGYNSIKLDTLTTMKPAIHIYESFGFEEIEAYRFNPLEQVIYMEKKLI
jgi:putative acetyltransferase